MKTMMKIAAALVSVAGFLLFAGNSRASRPAIQTALFECPAIQVVTIPGNPLTIKVAGDGSYQVLHSAAPPSRRRMVYHYLDDLGDAGLFVRYNNLVLQPDFFCHNTSGVPVTFPPSGLYAPWSLVSQSNLTGDGSSARPWRVDTALRSQATGVTLSSHTSYTNGSNSLRIDWQVCLPNNGTVATYLAADFYLQNDIYNDLAYGVYDPASGTVGSVNEKLTWLESLTPLTGGSRFAATDTRNLWAAIGTMGTPGAGFNNTINENAIDNGAGLQWEQAVNGCASFSAAWIFAQSPNLEPPTDVIFIPRIMR
jgi:hypothetical protein